MEVQGLVVKVVCVPSLKVIMKCKILQWSMYTVQIHLYPSQAQTPNERHFGLLNLDIYVIKTIANIIPKSDWYMIAQPFFPILQEYMKKRFKLIRRWYNITNYFEKKLMSRCFDVWVWFHDLCQTVWVCSQSLFSLRHRHNPISFFPVPSTNSVFPPSTFSSSVFLTFYLSPLFIPPFKMLDALDKCKILCRALQLFFYYT